MRGNSKDVYGAATGEFCCISAVDFTIMCVAKAIYTHTNTHTHKYIYGRSTHAFYCISVVDFTILCVAKAIYIHTHTHTHTYVLVIADLRSRKVSLFGFATI